MGVLDATARACLEDCRIVAVHVGEANEQRFGKLDRRVYGTQLFTMRVSSAERALKRAQDSFALLAELPSHSRAHRVCKKGYESASELLGMVESRAGRNKVAASAASLLRHCDRLLS